MGAYRVGVTGEGESQITAQQGNVEVFAPAGSEWVVEGQKMLVQGPADNPEFKIVSAVPRWRKVLRIAMMSMQIAAGVPASFSGGDCGSHRSAKTAPAAPPASAHPVGARPPAPPSSHPAAPPAAPGRGR